ncbi:MAG: EamA family transporter [Elusimicrobiota bacterium]
MVSVFLNFEILFTTTIAVIFLREHVENKFWIAVLFIFLASFFVTYDYNFKLIFSKGSVFTILACLFWAIDNNLTTKLSIRDPCLIAIVKGFVGGGINIFYYFTQNNISCFETKFILPVFIIGGFGYGVSLVLLIYSMRYIGASKSVAIFGTYPIFSFLFSVLILKEKLTFFGFLSFIFMSVSVFLIFFSKHSHSHLHKEEHEHLHSHNDQHHNHKHENFSGNLKHTHRHSHNIEHDHHHYSDYHHKHH